MGAGAGVEVDGADGVAGAAGEDVAGAGAGVALVDGAEAAGGAAAAEFLSTLCRMLGACCNVAQLTGIADSSDVCSQRILHQGDVGSSARLGNAVPQTVAVVWSVTVALLVVRSAAANLSLHVVEACLLFVQRLAEAFV